MGYRSEQRRRHCTQMGALRKTFLGWIARAQGGLCAGCGQPLNLSKKTPPSHADAPTVDHVFPRHSGGSHRLGNTVVMHRKCNGQKGGRRPTGCEYIWLLGVNDKLDASFNFGLITPDRSGEADKTAKQGLAGGESGLPRKGPSKP